MSNDSTPQPEGNGETNSRPESPESPGSPGPLPMPQPSPRPGPEALPGPQPPAEPAPPAPSEAVPAPEAPAVREEPAAPGTASEEAAEPPEQSGRQRLVAGLWPPRITRAQLIVAVLLFGLGLGLAIQVRSTSDSSALRGARQEDLVRILDELDDRTQRLEDEKARLEDQRTELESSSDQAEEARKQTLEKERQLGILAGTVAAQGPGITLTIDDGAGAVDSDMLLDAIQELRAAGAEAIQVNDVRVVADSYFSGADGDIEVDGQKIDGPYRFKVIGKPQDLEPALNIPGGVVQTLEKEQATATVTRSEKIVVDALRPAERPDYARSSSR
ncbi:DUF881 domain-containing protein [Streptomyces sp. SP18CS02]|uniref:DUF881 domain-containing protein n=1 Tax=Streptomyces sp. SP18CS02 TaxID=3002531 RepID=UPI002E7968FD|nr:DUF881 domain-containing protein [Streptomyces sp. SP18CS02]MEE1755525.1 DUF881 domain-containing protein [Streptomyces sp. SP18CS02]